MTWNWQKVIVYILGSIVLIVLGYLMHSIIIPKPTTKVETVIIHDTTYAKPKPPIIIHDTTYATRTKTTFTDSTSKSESGASVKVEHTISEIDKDLEKYPSYWKVDFIAPPERIIKEYITKDSIRTIVESKFVSLPFFLNPYFWSSLVLVVITALAIIF